MSKLSKVTHKNAPASTGLVKEVRNELRAQTRALEHRLNSRLESIEANTQETLASVHRIQVIVEEQRGENRIVLDGLKTLADRQDRLENEILSRRY